MSAAVLNSYAQKETVVIRPMEIQDVLVNPGMGITTFQRFNGQELNPPYTWSERGPVKELDDANPKPEFPDTSIAYLRWYWSTLEPEHGKFRWDIIDIAISEAQKHGQKLAIRLMPYSDRDPLPEWYRSSGARRANAPTDKDGAIWQPDFSDPLYLRYWGELVAAAGERYDGNPTLDSVDISSVGYWGEGWSNYMPAFQFQKPLIDLWLQAFPRTALLMNFDEPEALSYGTQHGAGWRLDCLGDMKMPYSEMLDQYPEEVARTGIQDVWKKHPVSIETCGTPATWLRDGYDVNYILGQALRWHVTSVNVKSSPIPAQWHPQFADFERRMGYRFILRRLEYPTHITLGSMMPVHMWWFNAGVAPIYQEYKLAVQLQSQDNQAVIQVPADVTKWLPGDSVVDESLYISSSLAPGKYRVRISLVDPVTGEPAIRLAIQGRQPDGWYDLGSIEVEKNLY
ncbi:MAG: DUF4832 domain-containing protein [Terracidiphilus sp.]|jgi:hypothetical protein